MSKAAFLDDNAQMALCYLSHSYDDLSRRILEQRESYTGTVFRNGIFCAYDVSGNRPLSKLYGFPCYVVRFVFSNMEASHVQDQEDCLRELCSSLREHMERKRGYYNLRIPAHFVDLMRSVGSELPGLIFCGGTMEELYVGGGDFPDPRENISLFFADRAYIEKYREKLSQIAYDSFRSYSGQYHISPVTSCRAGEIYRNWITGCFDSYRENSLLVAELDGQPAGYHLLAETETCVEGVLISVEPGSRGMGIYKRMLAQSIRYARERQKNFVTSTQIDNYQTQGTYGSLGMRQLYAIYNLHCDNRRENT